MAVCCVGFALGNRAVARRVGSNPNRHAGGRAARRDGRGIFGPRGDARQSSFALGGRASRVETQEVDDQDGHRHLRETEGDHACKNGSGPMLVHVPLRETGPDPLADKPCEQRQCWHGYRDESARGVPTIQHAP